MKKTKLTHISDFKVGDTIEILNKPEYWHSELNENDPLIANLTYPYVLTIKEIREDAMTCGNYGWDLDAIIEAGCNKIEIPKTWYVFVTEENQEVLFNWRFKDPSPGCKLTTDHIVGKSINSERGHNCRKLTKNFGNEISYEDFKKYILKESIKQKEMNTEKQIVEYKFKNEQFLEAAKKISSTSGVFAINSITYNTLNKLNLIDIWCDPVYEEEYKEGDYVIVKSYKQCGEGNGIMKDNSTCLILNHDKGKELNTTGLYRSKNSILVQTINKGYYGILPDHIIRKATDEEIKKFNFSELPEINGYKGVIESDYIKYGCANLHIQWFTQTDTRHIDAVALSSGVAIYKEQIDAIREYLRHKKLF